jgi:hypothetical protein
MRIGEIHAPEYGPFLSATADATGPDPATLAEPYPHNSLIYIRSLSTKTRGAIAAFFIPGPELKG